jgi:hypothetical protein
MNGVEQPPRTRIEPFNDPVDRTDYIGRFFSPELDVAYSISVKQDVLILSSIVFGDEALTQIGRDLFVEADAAPSPNVYQFERDARGQVNAVLIGTSDARNQRFDLMRE